MITFDFKNLLYDSCGEHGLSKKEIDMHKPLVYSAWKSCEDLKKNRTIGFFDLPFEVEHLNAVTQLHSEIKNKYDTLVVLGIGGSALGGRALIDAVNPTGMKIIFLDNVDPDYFANTISKLDFKTTVFNVITKSGSTAETLSQFLYVYEHGARNFIFTTDPEKGILRKLSQELNIQTLDVPASVGGRFSVLTPVGLLPALCAGVDIESVLQGAKKCATENNLDEIETNTALHMAYLFYLLNTLKSKSISVMMPYSHYLKEFSAWYVQLWGESLGKRKDNDGRDVFVGQTPLAAIGSTDQHSILQLLAEGPFDKITTFIKINEFHTKIQLGNSFSQYPEFSYLNNRTMNQLIQTECNCTIRALTEFNRPNCCITVPKLNAEVLGYLFYFYELKTAYSGAFYNINAFDQPGVELGKKYTVEKMSKI